MRAKSIVVSIDRVGGATAVAESDDGQRFEIPSTRFTMPLREGMVFRVPVDAKGKPRWEKAVADPGEERRRRADSENRMNRLRAADNGDDLKL